MTQIVGIAMIRNEDVFIQQSIKNVLGFCDKIIILDGYSSDGTWDIVQKLAVQYPQITTHQISSASDSHAFIASYANSHTWVFGIDGDEVYDPIGLAQFRKALIGGAYDRDWLLFGNVLHCTHWDQKENVARGYMNPPSKSMTKLYNFNAIYAWPGNFERFHNASGISFKPGYHIKSRRKLYFEYDWENSPFRCLHLCFMQRSSIRSFSKTRPGPSEAPKLLRILDRYGFRRLTERLIYRRHTDYKPKYYQRGDIHEIDTTAFSSNTR